VVERLDAITTMGDPDGNEFCVEPGPGEPLQRVLERAVEHYRREQFYAEFNAAFERLWADPVAWEEELAERAEREVTLADGLDDL
jgi:hypothetical protein